MKKALIILSVFVLMVLGVQSSWATTSTYNNYIQMIDGNDSADTTVTASVTDVNFPLTYNLYYQINSSGWKSYSPSITGNGGDVISFAVDVNNDSNIDINDLFSYDSSDATLSFSNPLSANLSQTPTVKDDYFRSVNIAWNGLASGFKLDILGTTSVADGYRAVPIPGSLLLLGSGVFGIIMFRGRRKAHA
jgi:hypothetical protein